MPDNKRDICFSALLLGHNLVAIHVAIGADIKMNAISAHKKKLIEVALPLEAINVASAREKSIRHGHPSTLHP